MLDSYISLIKNKLAKQNTRCLQCSNLINSRIPFDSLMLSEGIAERIKLPSNASQVTMSHNDKHLFTISIYPKFQASLGYNVL